MQPSHACPLATPFHVLVPALPGRFGLAPGTFRLCRTSDFPSPTQIQVSTLTHTPILPRPFKHTHPASRPLPPQKKHPHGHAAAPLKLRIHNSSVLWRSAPPCVVYRSVQQADSGWYEMQVGREGWGGGGWEAGGRGREAWRVCMSACVQQADSGLYEMQVGRRWEAGGAEGERERQEGEGGRGVVGRARVPCHVYGIKVSAGVPPCVQLLLWSSECCRGGAHTRVGVSG